MLNAEVQVQWTGIPKFLAIHKGVVSYVTLRKWIANGDIPHVRVGRKILLPLDAIERMAAGRKDEAQ